MTKGRPHKGQLIKKRQSLVRPEQKILLELYKNENNMFLF